jgi:putative PIN family toxin of toxin-antitoxin system
VRAILDTNVAVAAILWRGPPHALLEKVRDGDLQLVSSAALLAELADVLGRDKLGAVLSRTETSIEQVLQEFRQLVELIEPPPLPHRVCRDPDDDQVLALAQTANVDMLVSGDNDLLHLGDFAGIPIVTPADAIKRLLP